MWKFAFSTLDRRSHLRGDGAHLKLWKSNKNSFLIVFNEKYQVLMQPDGVHPANGYLKLRDADSHHWIYLGHNNDAPQFCTKINSRDFELEHHQQWADLRVILPQIAEPWASTIAYGKALQYWHRYHSFCGKCGSPTYQHKGGHERYCDACETSTFPRTDPAIIVSVTHKEEIFLARQSSWPQNRYSVLAGFVEPGESFEQAVEREVYEESQLDVSQIHYVGSQPWPFPCSVMIGFTAEAKNKEFHLLDQELEHGLWLNPDSLVEKLNLGTLKLPTQQSISYYLIERWAKQHSINLESFNH